MKIVLSISLGFPQPTGVRLDGHECGGKEEEPSCLDSLVAVPTSLPNAGYDALGTCWLQFLTLDELPSLEEIRDFLAKQQLELREIPKPAKNGASKASPGQGPAGVALVAETSMVTVAGGIKQAPPGSLTAPSGLPCSSSFLSSVGTLGHTSGKEQYLGMSWSLSREIIWKLPWMYLVCKTQPWERDFEARSPRALRAWGRQQMNS